MKEDASVEDEELLWGFGTGFGEVAGVVDLTLCPHPEVLGVSSSEALSQASSSAQSVLEYEANLGDGFSPM